MQKNVIKFSSLLLLAVFMLSCAPALAFAANSAAQPRGDGLYIEASGLTGSVTVKKNCFEAYKGQSSHIEAFKITVTIIPPEGQTLPKGLPGEPIGGDSYFFFLAMGKSVTFDNLPFGTIFSVSEDPGDYTFAVTYTVDGDNANTLTVGKKKHLVEVNNDFIRSPCATGSVSVTKVVDGKSAPSKEDFTFLITFFTEEEILGITDENPKAEGIQHTFTIEYSADGLANSRVFSGIPAGTRVVLQELTTGNFSPDITVNGDHSYAGKVSGNCELTFICTNTYKDNGGGDEATGSFIVTKRIELLNGATEPAGAEYSITVLFNYTGNEALPSFDAIDLDRARSGVQIKLKRDESQSFGGLPIGTKVSVTEDITGVFVYSVTIDNTAQETAVIGSSRSYNATVTNTYKKGGDGNPTLGKLTVAKSVELLNGATEPADKYYDITVLFNLTGSESLPSFDAIDLDRSKAGVQIKLMNGESRVFDALPLGTSASVIEDSSGSFIKSITIDGAVKGNVVVTANHSVFVKNTYEGRDYGGSDEKPTAPGGSGGNPTDPDGSGGNPDAPGDPSEGLGKTTKEPSETTAPSVTTMAPTDTVQVDEDPIPLDNFPNMPFTGGSGIWFIGLIGSGLVVLGMLFGKKQ